MLSELQKRIFWGYEKKISSKLSVSRNVEILIQVAARSSGFSIVDGGGRQVAILCVILSVDSHTN